VCNKKKYKHAEYLVKGVEQGHRVSDYIDT